MCTDQRKRLEMTSNDAVSLGVSLNLMMLKLSFSRCICKPAYPDDP